MDYGMYTNTGKPLAGYDPRTIMDTPNEEARIALMRQLGVANVDPPLPHSPCLKNIKTGVVLPWNELLAAQRDLVVCCDENGNTDEAAWGPKVIQGGPTNEELLLAAQQRLTIRKEAETVTAQYQQKAPTSKLEDGPSDYEKHDVISFDKIQELRARLHADD